MNHEQLMQILRRFVEDREWDQFHSPENLAKSISIESAELLELFQWNSHPEAESLVNELADVLTYCYLLADKLGVVPSDIVSSKLQMTATKYPVEKSKGKSEKYDRL